MSNVVRVRNGIPQWPYTISQLRIDEPQISLSNNPSAAELAALVTLDPPIFVYYVQPTAKPLFDETTQVVVPVFPVLVGDVWEQRWAVQNLPTRPADQPGFVVSLAGPVIDNTVSPPSYTYTWVVTELPPDYAGLHAEIEGSDLMDVALRKSTPTLTLSTGAARTLNESYTALNRINDVYAIERTSRELMVILDKLISRYNSELTDTPTLITRFQDRLTAWVNAVNFSTGDRDTLRGYLLQYVPTRGYLVP